MTNPRLHLLTGSLFVVCTAVGLGQTNTFPASGNVGIGTTAPSSRLTIEGTGNAVAIKSDGIPLTFSRPGLDTWQFHQTGVGHAGLSVFNATDGQSRLFLDEDGGIGIGTTSPVGMLDIANDSTGSEAANLLRLQSPSTNGARMNFVSTSVNGRNFGLGSNFILGNGEFGIHDYTQGATRMLIDSAGNVGIGTTNPAHKLAVNGAIRAKELIVDTGWADFVFDDAYPLQSLSEVERHIKAHRHLPGIPSATEVAAHGVNVGDMQARLLTKLEELTLHVIRLEKENTELHRRMQQLESGLAP